MTVRVETADSVGDTAVQRAVLRNARGDEAAVLSFGATLQWLRVPDRDGRVIDLAADPPGVQVYTGFKLNVIGRNGQHYGPRSGLCLETEAFPDSPNRPEFPISILRPGETYGHRMRIRLTF